MDWLPVKGPIEGLDSGPVTYKSRGLGRELGLGNLYISFNGCWPEIGARSATGSFKDLEAAPTLRMRKDLGNSSTLVVASAGNTARAFAQAASVAGQPVALVVPESAIKNLWITVEKGPLTIVSVKGDYFDAIQVAETISSLKGFSPEGGARNVARRDGMGTVVLDATLTLGKLPQHYFQAVGSGTGGIATWEASMRLIDDGRFGKALPRLHLAQSLPNAPIYYSWKGCSREFCPGATFDEVLFNRRPPYGMPGGVCDALKATDGDVYGISRQEAEEAKRLFESSEGIDILNAPAIAVAALASAARSGAIGRSDVVLLNITGGGLARLQEAMAKNCLEADIVVSKPEEAVNFMEGRY
jgi:cysteate synthase